MAKKLIEIDRNGTKYWEVSECPKCGGTGKLEEYAYVDNGTCWKCNGSGHYPHIVKEYTPEHQAKLDTLREKRQQARAKKMQEAYAEYEARVKAEEEAYAKEMEEAKKLQYIGNVGESIEMDVKFIEHRSFESHFGFATKMMEVYTFQDEHGNILVWITQSHSFYDVKQGKWLIGETFHIKAKIKEHKEYQGKKQTSLTRVKVK